MHDQKLIHAHSHVLGVSNPFFRKREFSFYLPIKIVTYGKNYTSIFLPNFFVWKEKSSVEFIPRRVESCLTVSLQLMPG